MSSLRWMPLSGLFLLLVFVPGALAHHCVPEQDNDPGLNVQSVAPPPSAALLAAFAIVPVIGLVTALAVAVPSLRSRKPVGGGSWVFTPAQWVYVPNRK